ncbi:hypothetical protein lerEdw1_004364 [Lerista edwardsae]|nr:hypothetical protein lerEdw1_004364 [Lerista edwardsae]
MSISPSTVALRCGEETGPADCPVDLFFVLDTSESVALRIKPYGALVDRVKDFTNQFIDELTDRYYRCDRNLVWNAGALHYSDRPEVIRGLTRMPSGRDDLKRSISGVDSIRKGTYTDCAIKNGIEELLVGGSHQKENKYLVVVTDGHPLDGYKEPCGGLEDAANEAKHQGIRVFSVAISPNHLESRLSVIATDHNHRQNFTATGSRQEIDYTIKTIIDMMRNNSEQTCCSYECQGNKDQKQETCSRMIQVDQKVRCSGPAAEVTNCQLSGCIGVVKVGEKEENLACQVKKEKLESLEKKAHEVTRAQEVQKDPRGRRAIVELTVLMAGRVKLALLGYLDAKDPQDLMVYKDLLDQKGTLVLMDLKETGESLGFLEGQAGLEMLASLVKGVSLEALEALERKENQEMREILAQMVPQERGAPMEKEAHPVFLVSVETEETRVSQDHKVTKEEKDHLDHLENLVKLGHLGLRDTEEMKGLLELKEKKVSQEMVLMASLASQDIQATEVILVLMVPKAILVQKVMKARSETLGKMVVQLESEALKEPRGTEAQKARHLILHCYYSTQYMEEIKVSCIHAYFYGIILCFLIECKCGPIDVLFVVDSSESIGFQNFQIAKDFVVKVIDRLSKDEHVTFDQRESRVGVVQYSHGNTQEMVALGDANIDTIGALKEAIKKLNWIAGGTYTGEALQFTKENLLRRFPSGTKRVAIVITDGRSDIHRDQTPLSALCEANTQVFPLGIGDIFEADPNSEQLSTISCGGLVISRPNYAELLDDTFLQNVTSYVCKDKVCPDYTCPIQYSGPADLTLLVDSSTSVGSRNFETTKKFVKRLAERFLTASKPAEDTARVSVVQYSGRTQQKLEARFEQNYTVIADAIDSMEFMNDATDVNAALKYVTNLYRQSSRSGAKKRVLIFSDGNSQGITSAAIERAVQEARQAGLEIYVLVVGTQANEPNIRVLVTGKTAEYDVAYGERHLFRVPDYNALLRGVFYQTVSRKLTVD